MALCPFATHKLIAPGSSDPRITPRAAILHVDAGGAESLFDYFKYRSGGIESHFFIKWTGEIEQYRDTDWQADANLDANDFAISIETQGFGDGKWTKRQLRSIKRLLLWLNKTHDIPLRKIQHAYGSGVGYHTQFGAPGPWTPVAKSCPGPNRIKQFNSTLVRWFRSDPAAPAPVPQPPVLDTLTVLAWNCYTANSDSNVLAALSDWVKKYDPDVVALSEAASHAPALKRFAVAHGMTLLQEPVPHDRLRGDDTGDVALLVAGDVKVRRNWLAKMTRLWKVFAHNVTHEPHAYQVASLNVRGKRWRVRGSHWPTHGFVGGNRLAVIESAKASRKWLRSSLFPSVDVGDLNEKLGILAAWYGQRFKVFGKGIDLAVTHRVASCEWKELPKGGSDHNGRLYEFTAKEPK